MDNVTDVSAVMTVDKLSISYRMYQNSRLSLWQKQVYTTVVDNLSCALYPGELFCVVGASGAGKTLLASAMLGLFDHNASVTGTITYQGKRCQAADLQALRGTDIVLMPQSVSALNPLMRVGRQVELASVTLSGLDAAQRRRHLFKRYGLSEEVSRSYPHQLSGGMMRRILLCMALMDNPQVLLVDEPTPGLDHDLAVRALQDLRAFADEGGSVMMISHDIDLACAVADRLAIFTDKRIVETISASDFSQGRNMRHPFTKALWQALPQHGFHVERKARQA